MKPGDGQRPRWCDPFGVAFVACAVLAVVGLGWIPLIERAWGFGLWHYLPMPVVAMLAAALVLLPWKPIRAAFARGLNECASWLGRVPVWLLVPLLALAFWLLRERQLYGDSKILLYSAGGSSFLFPDVGATFLFHMAHVLGGPGAGAVAVTQAFVCVAGALAVIAIARLGRELAPGHRLGGLAAAFLLCGGASRVFFGHVEVYAFVMLCGGLYLGTSCAFLAGRSGWIAPSLALGAGLWMHLSFVFLIPAHLMLIASGPGRATPARVSAALATVGAPVVGFVLIAALAGQSEELSLAWETLVQMAGQSPEPDAHESWVRSPFEEPGSGTKYVVFSLAHLKYLVNAFYVLAPATGIILLGFALARPRTLLEAGDVRFLASASLMMGIYAVIVRPVWGPYDWDVFSLTALCWSALAARLLLRGHAGDGAERRQLAAISVGASLLLVTAPFVAIGIAPARPAGLFAEDSLDVRPGESEWEAFERRIAPWL